MPVRVIGETQLAALLLSVVVAVACAHAAPPSRAPDITGEITEVTTNANGLRIRVEVAPTDASGSPKADVTTDGTTKWFSEVPGASPEQGGLARARPGARVSIWFEGPVAESYPVQARAGTVLVLLR